MGTVYSDPGYIGDMTPNVSDVEASWMNAIRDRVVHRFASVSLRDAAITSPHEGMLCYTTSENIFWWYTGSAWAQIYPTRVRLGGAAVSGGPTSSTTPLVLATLNLAAQTSPYELEVSAHWTGIYDTAADQFDLRVVVDGTEKARVRNRNAGGTNGRDSFTIAGITPVTIAAATACTVTVQVLRSGGSGTIDTDSNGRVNAWANF